MGFITQGQGLASTSKGGVKKVPEIGHLPGDKLGHDWAAFN